MAKAPHNEPTPEPVRWSLVAPFVAVLLFFAPVPQWAVEGFYSRDLYPWVQNVFSAGSNLMPFAVIDAMIVIAVVAVLYRIVRLFRVARRRGVIDAIWEAVLRVSRATACVLIVFFVLWGFNYRRQPLEATLQGGKAQDPTVDALQSVVADANALATRLRPLASPDEALSYKDIALRLRGPLDAALMSLGREPLTRRGVPKYSLVLTPFFTRAGVTGMINPLALETIVHPDLLPFERPFVLAHEWAHLSGHADEAEASAVGWLACMKGEPALAYSASLYLIDEAGGALPPKARRAAMDALSPDVRADLAAVAERRRKQNPRVQRTASRVYDEYLRANQVSDGTASYGRAVSLILSTPLREALSSYSIAKKKI